MRRISLGLMLLVVAGSSRATEPPVAGQTDSVDTVIVMTTGFGASHDEAVNSASRSAVQQVVGMLLSSEIVVENSKLIEDRIISHSRGYVERIEELAARSSDGLVQVDVRVWVRKQPLVEITHEIRIGGGALDGASLAAQFRTRDEQMSAGAELLQAAFHAFDRSVFTIKATEPPKLVSDGREGWLLRFPAAAYIDDAAWRVAARGLTDALNGVSVATAEAPFDRYGINSFTGSLASRFAGVDLGDNKVSFIGLASRPGRDGTAHLYAIPEAAFPKAQVARWQFGKVSVFDGAGDLIGEGAYQFGYPGVVVVYDCSDHVGSLSVRCLFLRGVPVYVGYASSDGTGSESSPWTFDIDVPGMTAESLERIARYEFSLVLAD